MRKRAERDNKKSFCTTRLVQVTDAFKASVTYQKRPLKISYTYNLHAFKPLFFLI